MSELTSPLPDAAPPSPLSDAPLLHVAEFAAESAAESAAASVAPSAAEPVAESAAEPTEASTDFDAPDRARRFGGVGRLYGEGALRRFEAARVAVIGVGGVGSWAVEALARTAIGHLTLIDLDHVAEGNTNRQLHALDGNYGKAKVDAMAERVRLIDPDCDVRAVDDFIEEANFEALLGPGFDYVIDAIDNTKVKTALIAWCVARGQKIITIGSAGGQIDPTRIRVDDLTRTIQDPLLAKVRQRLRQQYRFPRSLKTRFGVAAVSSDEPLRYPEAAACDVDDAGDMQSSSARSTAPAGLNCAGFGSSVVVTATFGLVAASHVLSALSVE